MIFVEAFFKRTRGPNSVGKKRSLKTRRCALGKGS